jgi:metallo-beta-lactamase class B
MFGSRLLLLSAGMVLAWGPLQAQVGEMFPTQPVPPVILPFEPGGSEVELHTRENDSKPFPPHRMIGNIYYVGQADYISYLITSDQGHILIDATFESGVPLIRKSVEQLGFRFQDIKVLLLTHAHGDHAEGAARVKELSGAQVMVMDGDAQAVESGAGGKIPAVRVSRVLHDKDEIRVGNNIVTAYLAAGHTKGNTTFAWKTVEGGRTLNVVLIGSLTSWATQLRLDPSLVDDYRRTFRSLRELPCDVFLGPHGKMFGLTAKYAKLGKGGPNPYIDPEGYRAHIDIMEKSFYYKLDWAHR